MEAHAATESEPHEWPLRIASKRFSQSWSTTGALILNKSKDTTAAAHTHTSTPTQTRKVIKQAYPLQDTTGLARPHCALAGMLYCGAVRHSLWQAIYLLCMAC
jgi:hypothetical protein